MLNSKFQQRTTYITVLEGGLFFLGERAQVFESRRIKNNTELNKKCKYHFQMPPAFETLRDRVRIDAGWYKTFQQQINIRGGKAIVVQNVDEKKKLSAFPMELLKNTRMKCQIVGNSP